jgi:hypothetical protein
MSKVTEKQKLRKVQERARQRRWQRQHSKSRKTRPNHRCKTHLLYGDDVCPYLAKRQRRSKGWLKRHGLWRAG